MTPTVLSLGLLTVLFCVGFTRKTDLVNSYDLERTALWVAIHEKAAPYVEIRDYLDCESERRQGKLFHSPFHSARCELS